MDVNMIVPNLLGTVITVIQIATYFYFYCKNHGVPPEIKEEGQEEDIKGSEEKNENDKAKPDNEEKLMDDSNI